MENPQIQLLLELRKELETEIEELRARIKKLDAYIRALDANIGTSSFTTADKALKARSEAPVEPEPPIAADTEEEFRSVTLLNKDREIELATLEITENEITIIPAPHGMFDIKRGAFARFLVEKVLGKFQREDRERVENNEIEWDTAFDFEVRAEDGILKEIVIKNYGDDSRLTEIQRSLRWSLEKTYRPR
ncbi:MAG: hypothetical protein ACW97A_01370 [Candidatus Thorarchaeota archaeon]